MCFLSVIELGYMSVTVHNNGCAHSEGCSHIQLLKEESFSTAQLKSDFKPLFEQGGYCDITLRKPVKLQHVNVMSCGCLKPTVHINYKEL